MHLQISIIGVMSSGELPLLVSVAVSSTVRNANTAKNRRLTVIPATTPPIHSDESNTTEDWFAPPAHNVVTAEYLQNNPHVYFVYGDNQLYKGTAGGARFRYFINTYGFVTKRAPSMDDAAFFRPEDYRLVFVYELTKLRHFIQQHPDSPILISKIGSGLANRYRIWETIIQPALKPELSVFPNVYFLFD